MDSNFRVARLFTAKSRFDFGKTSPYDQLEREVSLELMIVFRVHHVDELAAPPVGEISRIAIIGEPRDVEDRSLVLFPVGEGADRLSCL